jgi:choline transport protein
VITSLLSLINIGSTAAFNAIGSLAVSALLATYMISFTCLIIRRLGNEPLPPRRWSLGRAGIFINFGAVVYLLIVWVFIFFPTQTPVTPSTMNVSDAKILCHIALETLSLNSCIPETAKSSLTPFHFLLHHS